MILPLSRGSSPISGLFVFSACSVIAVWGLLLVSSPGGPEAVINFLSILTGASSASVAEGGTIVITNTTKNLARPTHGELSSSTLPVSDESSNPNSNTPHPKHAFATILTGDGEGGSATEKYLTATRLLIYQLLHSSSTASKTPADVLVLVTDDVDQETRDQLRQDGASVLEAETLSREWIRPKWARWGNVLAKLNLWKLTDYEKIAFLDADSVLFRPIQDIFSDPAAAIQKTLPAKDHYYESNFTLPESYMIAGIHDHWVEAALPPKPENPFYVKDNYMNAGFFVISPSEEMYQYYLSILDTPERFDPSYPEQNLLNYAHRVDGRVPWKDIGSSWSMKGGVKKEHYENGLKSIHQKWWEKTGDEFINGLIADAKKELDGFLLVRYGANA